MYRALTAGLAAVGRALTQKHVLLAAVRPSARRTVAAPPSAYASRAFDDRLPAAAYLDHENYNAHNAMMNDPAYSDTVINTDVRDEQPAVTDRRFHQLVTRDFGATSADDAFDAFREVTAYATGRDLDVSDAPFDGLRGALAAALPRLSDARLMDAMRLMTLWSCRRSAKDPVYRALWSEFDRQCVQRYGKWSLNKVLLFMDCWYLMRLSRMSDFVWLAVRKLARKPSRLTPKQLVQTMFYANTSRKFLPTVPMYDVEAEISSYYNDYNIKELCILALGFFKTQTPIRSQDLVKSLYESVIKEIKNVNSIELAAFLKIFRYCTKHQNADFMYKLMDVLMDRVDDVQLVCCTHMALLGTNLLIKHDGLLKKVSKRIVDEMSQARIKDLERITLALTMLNHDPQTSPCIYETIVKELRSDTRLIDFEQRTHCYIFTLAYLAIHNIFPHDCISKSLDPETLHKCFGKKLSRFTIPRDLLSLNNSLRIECPDYTGPLLPDALNKSCNEHFAWHLPTSSTLVKESPQDKVFLKLYRELVLMFKDESYLHVCYPLPHHPKCDILFCMDANGKPVTIPETIKSKTAFNDFHKPPELGKWFALMVLVRNSVLYYSNECNGLTVCKIRQLKTLNYEPILVTTKEIQHDDIHKILLERLKDHNVTLN